MEKTITFVNLFKNVKEDGSVSLSLTARIGEVFASSTDIPPMDMKLFTKAVSKTGIKHLRTKRPVELTYANLHKGDKADAWFFNAVAVEATPQADQAEILALFEEPAAQDDEPTTQDDESAPQAEEF
jgi:hypothetical protein